MYELHKSEEPMLARTIAEELDVSSNLIAARGKKLDEKSGLIKRQRSVTGMYEYCITAKAKDEYFTK